jgi:O-antigen/teichoic acid export membrane protein
MNDYVRSVPERDDNSRQSPYASANLRGIIKYYLCSRVLAGVSGVLFAVLLVRHMDLVGYSRFATVLGIAGTVGILSSLGIEKAVTCFVPEGRIQLRGAALSRFIWRLLQLRTGVLVLMTGILLACWSYFSGDRAYPGAQAGLIALLIVGTNFFQFLVLVLQSLVQQKTLARVMVVQWGGRLLALALMLTLSPRIGLEQALYVMVVPEIAGSIMLFIVLRRYLKGLCSAQGEGRHVAGTWPAWRSVSKLMRHNYGYSWLITAPQGNSMIVIGSVFLTALQLGAYGFYVNLIERIRSYLPLNLMLNLAEPLLIAGYVEDRNFQRLCRRANLLYKPNFALLMLLFAWSCAVSPVITRLLTGGKYMEYSVFLPLLIAQVTLGSRNTILQVIVNGVGRSEILSKSGATALACMGLAFASFLFSGTTKLLLLTTPLVFEVVNCALTILLLKRAGLAYEWDGAFHLKVISAAAIAFAAAYGAQYHLVSALYQVLAAGVAAALAFGASCRFLRILDVEDLVAAQRLLRGRFAGDK